jgi:hypothetical protein
MSPGASSSWRPRSLGHAIVRDPEQDNPAHALICPPPQIGENRRKKDARKIALAARFLTINAPESVLPAPTIADGDASTE